LSIKTKLTLTIILFNFIFINKSIAKIGCSFGSIIEISVKNIKVSFSSKSIQKSCIESYKFKFFPFRNELTKFSKNIFQTNESILRDIKYHLDTYPNLSRHIVFTPEFKEIENFFDFRRTILKFFKGIEITLSDKVLMKTFKQSFELYSINQFKRKKVSLVFENKNKVYTLDFNQRKNSNIWKEWISPKLNNKKNKKIKLTNYQNQAIELSSESNNSNYGIINFLIHKPNLLDQEYFQDERSRYPILKKSHFDQVRFLNQSQNLKSFYSKNKKNKFNYYRVSWEKFYFLVTNTY
tara:strand:- start:356 stop:1237 length:882 start_codon:yes stop_codon:yes gene_type:complete